MRTQSAKTPRFLYQSAQPRAAYFGNERHDGPAASADPTRARRAGSSKLQHPSSSEAPTFSKYSIGKNVRVTAAFFLRTGAWCLPGAWCLDLGASRVARARGRALRES